MPGFDRRLLTAEQPLTDAEVRGVMPRLKRLSRRYATACEDAGVANGTAYMATDLARKAQKLWPKLQGIVKLRSLVKANVLDNRKSTVPLLGIKATGGIGDMIVIARYLRDLAAVAGPFEYDLYSNNPAVANWVFAAVPGLMNSRSDQSFSYVASAYPSAVEIVQMARIRRITDTGRRAPNTFMQAALRTAANSSSEFAEFLDVYPFRDGELADRAVERGWSRRNLLQATHGIFYRGDEYDLPMDKDVYQRFGLVPGSYITVHNGFDSGFPVRGVTATKCYPHFSEVVERLRKTNYGLKIVQVGTSTSLPLRGVDVDLISRTNLKEVAAVVAGSALHLDNEGGLVHIASCYGVRSAVVFGPTNAAYFSYPCNINVLPSSCGNCWWATDNWMEQCPAGYGKPRCMTEQDPANVASRIDAIATDALHRACALKSTRASAVLFR